jgi:transposase-like protein
MEFVKQFPDDEACLQWLRRNRHSTDGEHAWCPLCEQVRTFRRYQTARPRQTWTCTSCTHQLHPTSGTIFHKSSTSLQLWFYAMWLMTSTRCGISAKQLERELGVTYKTAWRMFNLIRNRLMSDDAQGPTLSGEVEADETFIGGKPRESLRREVKAKGWNMQTAYWDRKAIVFGAVERKGQLRASVIPTSRGYVVRNKVREYVLPESLIYTDEYTGYVRLGKSGYRHRRIKHAARVYVEGDTHTQTIDGFFALLKNGIRGVHHGVSHKWLQGYVNEYVFRWNHREDAEPMFFILLRRSAFTS